MQPQVVCAYLCSTRLHAFALLRFMGSLVPGRKCYWIGGVGLGSYCADSVCVRVLFWLSACWLLLLLASTSPPFKSVPSFPFASVTSILSAALVLVHARVHKNLGQFSLCFSGPGLFFLLDEHDVFPF